MKKLLPVIMAAACLLCSALAHSVGPTLSAEILFAEGSTSISSRYLDTLEVMVCTLKRRKLETFILVGHADSREKDAEHLAKQRVLGVSRALVKMGIDPQKIYTESKGSKQPVSISPEKSSANRRVDVEMLNTPLDDEPSGCMRRWERELYSLKGNDALVAAKKLVSEDGWNTTALFRQVIYKKRPDLLASFLKGDSGISLAKPNRVEVLEVAARTGQPAMIQPFIEAWTRHDVPPPLTGVLRSVACAPASVEDKIQTVHLLFNWGGDLVLSNALVDYSPLDCLNGSKDAPLIDLLLSIGVDPKQPEWLIAKVGHDREMVQRLLRSGANPLAETQTGRTLFHTFRLESSTDVEWLISLGLDINATDKSGDTPLHSAVGYAGKEILDYMLKSGAKLREFKEGSLLSSAQKNPEAFIWLLQHGATVGNEAELLMKLCRQGPLMLPAVSALVERGVSVNQKDSRGDTALAIAIHFYHPAVVRYLLQVGADQNQVTKYSSAIQLAEKLDGIIFSGCSDCSYVPQNPSLEHLRAKQEIIELLVTNKNGQLR